MEDGTAPSLVTRDSYGSREKRLWAQVEQICSGSWKLEDHNPKQGKEECPKGMTVVSFSAGRFSVSLASGGIFIIFKD